MPIIYRNPRTNRTFRVEPWGLYHAIVERDWQGEYPEVMAKYLDHDRAQDQLDKLAANLDWERVEDNDGNNI